MKIAIFGASGMIGSHLKEVWSLAHEVLVASRSKEPLKPGQFFWSPSEGILAPEALEGVDLFVNLAGENISTGRWNEEKKKRILDSRVVSTKLISETVSKMAQPPKMWIQASAIGTYGSRGDEELDESSSSGKGFLASVCRQWESAAKNDRGVKIAFARFGVVLSTTGGALEKMLQPFKLGLGGRIGSGKQWMSWIALDEIPPIFDHIVDKELAGPINIVAKEPVTNAAFTKALSKVLKRPAFFPLPAAAAKGLLGEMAEELLLSSVRTLPKALIDSGYQFKYESLEEALRRLIELSE